MTSLLNTTFGEYIRLLRNENGLTLTQLAAKLDLDSANLSKIENGKRDFDEKRLAKLARIFKLNLKDLRNEYVTDQIAVKKCRILSFLSKRKVTSQIATAAGNKAIDVIPIIDQNKVVKNLPLM